MRRLDIAMIALVATTFGASVCVTPTLAKPPVKKSSSKKKSVSRSRRDRKGCPPVRRTRKARPTRPSGTRTVTPPRVVTNTIIKDRVVKATIDQATLDQLRRDIIAGIKFPEMTTTKVDLSSIEARLTAQEAMINSLLEQSKKDRTFDLRKTAHFEEQLCDILTLVKKQQECIDELCKKNGMTRSAAPAMNMAPAAAAAVGAAAIKPARLSIARDIDGNIFNGNRLRVQTGYDLGKFPGVPRLLGGDSAPSGLRRSLRSRYAGLRRGPSRVASTPATAARFASTRAAARASTRRTSRGAARTRPRTAASCSSVWRPTVARSSSST